MHLDLLEAWPPTRPVPFCVSFSLRNGRWRWASNCSCTSQSTEHPWKPAISYGICLRQWRGFMIFWKTMVAERSLNQKVFATVESQHGQLSCVNQQRGVASTWSKDITNTPVESCCLLDSTLVCSLAVCFHNLQDGRVASKRNATPAILHVLLVRKAMPVEFPVAKHSSSALNPYGFCNFVCH